MGSHDDAATTRRTPSKWAVLYTVLVMTFMATLDSSIVNVALPVMARELGVEMGQIQWVASIYLLISCSVILIFGRLGDLFGMTRVYQAGVALFTLGSALCALSGSLPLLIVGRAVQSLGGGAALANNMGIITRAFPAHERGKSLGMVASFVALGTLTGPTLGGFLTSVFNWQAIFTVNIPVGILAFAAGVAILPRERPTQDGGRRRIDVKGAMLMGAAVLAIFCSLNLMESGVTPALLALLAVGVLLLVAFVAVERHVAEPLVPLSIFRDPWFDVNLLTLLAVFICFGAFNLVMPFYLQDAHGFDVGFAGLIMTTYPLVNFFVGPLSGTVSDHIGCELPTTLGLAVYAVGLGLTRSLLTPDSAVALIVALYALMSLGTSSFQSPNNALIMGSAPADALGFMGSLTALTRYMGMTIGITAGSGLLYGQMSAAAGEHVTGYVAGRPDIYMYGFRWVFGVLFALVVVALALSAARLVRARRK